MNLGDLQSARSKERQKDSLQHLREDFYADIGRFVEELRTERERAAAAADDPFADMNTPEEDPFGTGQGVFEQVDAGSVDADEVWDSITDDGDGGHGLVVPDGSRYAEVSKHAFCEQCEHFSEPPDVHCSREGTEIIEFLDMETVRLLDCPVVADREELE